MYDHLWPLAIIEEPGKPSEEECPDLLVLNTKQIADPAVIENSSHCQTDTNENITNVDNNSFRHTQRIANTIDDRTKTFNKPASRSKLSSQKTRPQASKEREASMKHDLALFARLCIGCQNHG